MFTVSLESRPIPWVLLALVSALVLWVYWPGQYGPWLFDDRSNLFILDSMAPTFQDALDHIFSNTSGPLGRPVSMATFVIERAVFGADPALAKLFNTALHIANGLLVAWLYLLVLRTGNPRSPAILAVLCAAAWMLAPIHVSAVLYVVQRMTLLAAFFGLLFLIVYFYWRTSFHNTIRLLLSSGLLLLTFFLAVFAKENAVVILPIVLLMESLCLRGQGVLNEHHARRLFLYSRLSTVALLLAASVMLVLNWNWVESGYAIRDFTVSDRIYTQGRVLWDYLGQILWPDLNALGIYHDDYRISRALFDPLDTFWALLAWGLVIVCALAFCLRPLGGAVAFAVLWFLVAHSIESSILALEIYFEHRNYLPSVGLFLLMAILLERFTRLKAVLNSVVAIFLVYLLLVGARTSSQVQIWSSGPLIRINHAINHPNSFRANRDMAIQLASVGALEPALEYSSRARQHGKHESEGDHEIFELALYCLAEQTAPPSLFAALGTSNLQRPFTVVANMHGLFKTLQQQECTSFDRYALGDRLARIYLADMDATRASANMYSVIAGFENELGRMDKAFAYTQLLLELSSEHVRGLLMYLHFATVLGETDSVNRAVELLDKLQSEGKLSTADARTLSYYLEGE